MKTRSDTFFARGFLGGVEMLIDKQGKYEKIEGNKRSVKFIGESIEEDDVLWTVVSQENVELQKGFQCGSDNSKDYYCYYAPIYENALGFSTKCEWVIFRLKSNKKVGVIDRSGNSIIPFLYSDIKSCSVDGAFIMAKDSLYGLWKNKKMLVSYKYSRLQEIKLQDTQSMLFVARKENTDKEGIIDENNKVVLPFEYTQISFHSSPKENYFYSLSQYNKEKRATFLGLYSPNLRKHITPCKFKDIKEFREYNTSLALVTDSNDVTYYIDEYGTEYYEK